MVQSIVVAGIRGGCLGQLDGMEAASFSFLKGGKDITESATILGYGKLAGVS